MERTDQTPEMAALDILKAKIKKHISTFDVIIFFSTLGLSLLVHMYMFTHKFINYDDIHGMYSHVSYLLSSGRFLMQPLTKLGGCLSSPWFHGILGCIFMAAGVVFVIRIFKIKHYVPAILCALCMISFPTIASTFSFMFCSYQYLFSFAAAIFGAYLIRKEKILPILFGAVMIALSMGCYQAYFGMSTILLVLILIFDICDGRFLEKPKTFIFVALKYLAGLALGMALYFILLKIFLYINGAELTTYQGISSMGKMTFSELLDRIKRAYGAFFAFPQEPRLTVPFSYATFSCFAWATWILDLAITVYSVIKKKIYKNWVNLLYLILLLIVVPLATCIIYVMAGGSNIYDLMTYPLVMSIVIPSIIADRIRIKKFPLITVSLAIVLLLSQCYFVYVFTLATNRAYFLMDMTYENTYAYFVKMTARIESFDGWNKECKVAIIGNATTNAGVPTWETTHMDGITIGNSALNIYTRTEFFELFVNSKYVYADTKTNNEIQASDQFQSMPVYPETGSIAMFDDVLVVKLGN